MDKPTTAERRRVVRYLNKVLPLLGLRDWDVFVADAWDDDDVMASIEPTPNTFEATLYLGKHWAGNGRTDVDRGVTLIHELLHLTNSSVCQFVSKAVIPALPEKAQDPLRQAFEDLDEQFIHKMAAQWYRVLPRFGE